MSDTEEPLTKTSPRNPTPNVMVLGIGAFGRFLGLDEVKSIGSMMWVVSF